MSTNKNSKFSLKALLEEAFFFEEAAPDALPEDPFGQYLFAPIRYDVPKPKEPNTDEEKEFLKALEHLFNYDKTSKLTKLLPSLLSLVKKGKYTKFLVPPKSGRAYRFMQVDVETASKILGVSIEKIKNSPEMVPFYVTGCPDYVPLRGEQLSSWTMDPEYETMSKFTYTERFYGETEMVSIVLVAETSKNTFLLNPEELTKSGIYQSINNYYYEMETIGVGPIKILEAAYVRVLRREKPSMSMLSYDIHGALMSALKLKQRGTTWELYKGIKYV
jgi:hypothetical protein